MCKKELLNKSKGITLISLVITIIVLLILAGVALNSLIGSTSIIENANKAADSYNNAVEKENTELRKIVNIIKSDGTYEEEILNEQGYLTQNYNYKSSTNSNLKITIPKGFSLLNASGNVVTNIQEYTTILTDANITENGIVVKAKDGSEFVWVPVQDVTDMYWTSDTRRVGQMYFNDSGNNFGTKRTQYQTNGGIGEATTVDADGESSNTLVSGENSDTKKAAILNKFQSEFEAMITSVQTYGGFYVGRYETSVINEKVKSVKTTVVDQILRAEEYESKDQCVNNWYGLYNTAQRYASDAGVSNSVTSCMIWGCAYDQIMLWMQNNGINVKSTEMTQGNFENDYINTGSNDSYKFNNIYDLCGNHLEWTMTSMWSGRAVRGGYKGSTGDKTAMSSSEGVGPSAQKSEATTRIQLFLKV